MSATAPTSLHAPTPPLPRVPPVSHFMPLLASPMETDGGDLSAAGGDCSPATAAGAVVALPRCAPPPPPVDTASAPQWCAAVSSQAAAANALVQLRSVVQALRTQALVSSDAAVDPWDAGPASASSFHELGDVDTQTALNCAPLVDAGLQRILWDAGVLAASGGGGYALRSDALDAVLARVCDGTVPFLRLCLDEPAAVLECPPDVFGSAGPHGGGVGCDYDAVLLGGARAAWAALPQYSLGRLWAVALGEAVSATEAVTGLATSSLSWLPGIAFPGVVASDDAAVAAATEATGRALAALSPEALAEPSWVLTTGEAPQSMTCESCESPQTSAVFAGAPVAVHIVALRAQSPRIALTAGDVRAATTYEARDAAAAALVTQLALAACESAAMLFMSWSGATITSDAMGDVFARVQAAPRVQAMAADVAASAASQAGAGGGDGGGKPTRRKYKKATRTAAADADADADGDGDQDDEDKPRLKRRRAVNPHAPDVPLPPTAAAAVAADALVRALILPAEEGKAPPKPRGAPARAVTHDALLVRLAAFATVLQQWAATEGEAALADMSVDAPALHTSAGAPHVVAAAKTWVDGLDGETRTLWREAAVATAALYKKRGPWAGIVQTTVAQASASAGVGAQLGVILDGTTGGGRHGGARHGLPVSLADATKLALLANEERNRGIPPRALQALFASLRSAQRAANTRNYHKTKDDSAAVRARQTFADGRAVKKRSRAALRNVTSAVSALMGAGGGGQRQLCGGSGGGGRGGGAAPDYADPTLPDAPTAPDNVDLRELVAVAGRFAAPPPPSPPRWQYDVDENAAPLLGHPPQELAMPTVPPSHPLAAADEPFADYYSNYGYGGRDAEVAFLEAAVAGVEAAGGAAAPVHIVAGTTVMTRKPPPPSQAWLLPPSAIGETGGKVAPRAGGKKKPLARC